jgi:hypothetical protein
MQITQRVNCMFAQALGAAAVVSLNQRLEETYHY